MLFKSNLFFQLVIYEQFSLILLGYTKLVVIGGEDSTGSQLRSIEVIDLANPSRSCNAIADYPIYISAMAVGLFDGFIKSCGSSSDTDECYDYDPVTNTWSVSPLLTHSRKDPKASFIDGIWLVSGDSDGSQTGATTDMWTGSSFEFGPTAPVDMFLHCQLTVNSTHVFFANSRTMTSSYLLEWSTQTWTELDPPYYSEFHVPSCGLINNSELGTEAIIVEDGKSEIFSFQDLMWRQGPTLPDFDFAGTAQLEDTFVLFGGNDASGASLDTIYQFDNENYEFVLLNNRLQTGRSVYPGGVFVPDDFVTCS